MKSWSCGAPSTTIPNALLTKEKEIFYLNGENFHHNNANEQDLAAKSRTVALFFINPEVLSGNRIV